LASQLEEPDDALAGRDRPMIPTSSRYAWKLGFLVLLQTTLLVAALFAAYFLLPTRNSDEGSDLPWLILELCVFGVIVGLQVPAIVNAKHPVLRAVETLAIIVPLYLLIFARIYLSYSLNDPSTFSQPLNDVTALYFTVTVFASVGFGDIVAQTDTMRLFVTAQMLLNLVLFGAVIRLLALAARRGVARRDGQAAVSELGRPGD
jgi:voltage-gated potassium channel